MTGGMVKDALDETGIEFGRPSGRAPQEMDFEDKLRKLHGLYEDGIISEQEYRREKKEILDEN